MPTPVSLPEITLKATVLGIVLAMVMALVLLALYTVATRNSRKGDIE